MIQSLFEKLRKTIYNKVNNKSDKAMPDYSILSETQLTLLLEYALFEYWDEKYDIEKISNLKMHKIMFEVSEEENLPITRSWYIFGNNLHQREIVRREFGWLMLVDPQNILLQDGSSYDIQQLIQEYHDIYIKLKECVISFIERSKIVFTSKDEYLRQLYDGKAPQKYAACYRASLEYRIFLSKLEKFISIPKFSERLKVNCINKTTELHKQIIHINEFSNFFESLMDYTDTIEGGLLKNVLLSKRGETLTEEQINFFKGQDAFYVEYVWKPFAKLIAIETVKGPRKEQIISEYKHDLHDFPEIHLNILENNKKAKDLKLFLTKDEFNELFRDKQEQINKIILAGDILQRG